jgi:hypothetical protein
MTKRKDRVPEVVRVEVVLDLSRRFERVLVSGTSRLRSQANLPPTRQAVVAGQRLLCIQYSSESPLQPVVQYEL